MHGQGVIAAIEVLGRTTQGKSDKEQHLVIKQVIKAMETRNSKWPSDELTKVVHNLDNVSRDIFLAVLKDMDQGLTEYYGGE